ncbi:MAG: hypothetical protein KGY51_01935 [Psychroflexus sp.]|nr:hypothetical protein [Psychroflexus sp.]
MKNLFLFLFTMCVYTINAQIQDASIKPLESYYLYPNNDNFNIQDGFYFKDVNYLLEPYVGTWVGNYDNKTLHLEISIQYDIKSPARDVSFDKLLIKYKITNSNGQDLINTLNMFDSYRYHINGKYFSDSPLKYYANYTGYEHECNQTGTAVLELQDNNTMTLWVIGDRGLVLGDCPDGNIHILPTEGANAVVLNKQN